MYTAAQWAEALPGITLAAFLMILSALALRYLAIKLEDDLEGWDEPWHR